jgi:6,7-dimethyl-8-ribityllumazine synthase
MKTIEGEHGANGLRVALVVSRFNEFVTSRLLAGATEVLGKAGIDEQDLLVVRVPGAFELPLVVRRLAKGGRFDAIICLGAVIRGETPHFEYISSEASRGIAQASWDFDVPVVFGVLTTDTAQQALERAGEIERNRGADAARTAVEMANLLQQLDGTRRTVKRSVSARRDDSKKASKRKR